MANKRVLSMLFGALTLAASACASGGGDATQATSSPETTATPEVTIPPTTTLDPVADACQTLGMFESNNYQDFTNEEWTKMAEGSDRLSVALPPRLTPISLEFAQFVNDIMALRVKYDSYDDMSAMDREALEATVWNWNFTYVGNSDLDKWYDATCS